MNVMEHKSPPIGQFGIRALIPLWAILAAVPLQAAPVAPLPESEPVASAEDSALDSEADEFADMDLDQLANVDVVVPSLDIEVTSVSKQESTVGRSPAAIFVVSSEMIRRSGATTIPDLLRLVPGLQVSRIDASSWAVSSRGFNSYYTGKLLVMIDGRNVYNRLVSGVFWDVQDTLLEDIERIEVIRGPGGTLWGENAVNGVINIITKKASDTQGALITTGIGYEDKTINGFRYGKSHDNGLSWRIYGKHFERGTGFEPPGGAGIQGPHDDWRMGRGGFRADWELDPCAANTLTVQGDVYNGIAGHKVFDPITEPPFEDFHTAQDFELDGMNVLTRFTHIFDDESDWTLQAYYDRAVRSRPVLRSEVDSFDVDFQHRFPLSDRHGIIWGLGYRRVEDRQDFDGFVFSFDPAHRTTHLYSTFVQDQITLADDLLYLTVGSKFEHNDFTGFEYQPSARLLWTPDPRRSAWASISRAVRTPSRLEHDGTSILGGISEFSPVPGDPRFDYAIFPMLVGVDTMPSEELLAYEIGYRAQTTDRFSWDIAVFLNQYENLLNGIIGTTYPFVNEFGRINGITPIYTGPGGGMRGQTYGFELFGQYAVSDRWRLSGYYSLIQAALHDLPGFAEGFSREIEGDMSPNQARLGSSWDLGCCWEFDLALRYMDYKRHGKIPSYIEMDAQLAWAPTDHFEFAVAARNLFDSHHYESGGGANTFWIAESEVQRTVFAKCTWRY
jgi:iron complex outermembrane recepter protein